MNTHLTEIAFILDRSGSMAGITGQTIDGFNRFLADQQALPGTARITLVLFSDEYEVPVKSVPAGEVAPLNGTTYRTRGCSPPPPRKTSPAVVSRVYLPW